MFNFMYMDGIQFFYTFEFPFIPDTDPADIDVLSATEWMDVKEAGEKFTQSGLAATHMIRKEAEKTWGHEGPLPDAIAHDMLIGVSVVIFISYLYISDTCYQV